MITLDLDPSKKVYFTSDHHFGAPTRALSQPREHLFLEWLNVIEKDAGALFIVGDLFDFWFEYKKVVPKGFVRILGKLAQMRDNGLPIYFFVGNHDLWMEDYFLEELNIPVFHEPQQFLILNKVFFIGHGDGLGPGDKGYKRMKKVFTNPFSKWLFRWLHPDIGVSLAEYLSVKNKLISGEEDARFLGEENEWLILYANRKVTEEHADYFIFGHRHLPMVLPLKNKPEALYINLGDWIKYFTFGVFSAQGFDLKCYRNRDPEEHFHPGSNRDV